MKINATGPRLSLVLWMIIRYAAAAQLTGGWNHFTSGKKLGMVSHLEKVFSVPQHSLLIQNTVKYAIAWRTHITKLCCCKSATGELHCTSSIRHHKGFPERIRSVFHARGSGKMSSCFVVLSSITQTCIYQAVTIHVESLWIWSATPSYFSIHLDKIQHHSITKAFFFLWLHALS